ncbi:MAG UNVERIFIED_CONTAM: thioredoxin [Anaerolineae bacterium]|jgi:thioredoxin 1
MGQGILEITAKNFDKEVNASELPVLVDFWAEWCGPCKMIAPIVDEIATEYAGTLKVGKLDADTNQELVMNFGIIGIPTLILFKNGEPVARITGMQPKAKILSQLTPHLT